MQCVIAISLAFPLLVSSCAQNTITNVAPPLVDYTYAQQKKAANELRDARKRYEVVPVMIDDYGLLRKAIRENGETK